MVSLDLKDAYLQVPVHPDKLQVPQFRSFWPGLLIQGSVLWSLHGASGLHQSHGSSLDFPSCRYPHPSLPGRLADPSVISFADHVGLGSGSSTCQSLGIIVNWEESHLVPAQQMIYLGILLEWQSFRACPEESREASLNRRRIPILQRAASVILARNLGSPVVADSLSSRRSSQNALSSASTSSILRSPRPVQFWCGGPWIASEILSGGWCGLVSKRAYPCLRCPPTSTSGPTPWTWVGGAHVGGDIASGLWSPQEKDRSINARELLSVERGLLHFAPQLMNLMVAVFADNSAAVAYLRNQVGTRSPLLNSIAQRIIRWAESVPVTLAPQFIMGKNNVLADALSQPNQILGSEWTLKWEVFLDLRKHWPVMIDLFATSLNHQC